MRLHQHRSYNQSDPKNASIADYSFDNELNTFDNGYDPVEEQCIDIECTTKVHVHHLTQLKQKVLECVETPCQIFKLYPSDENASVKLSITINWL